MCQTVQQITYQNCEYAAKEFGWVLLSQDTYLNEDISVIDSAKLQNHLNLFKKSGRKTLIFILRLFK